MKTIFTVKGTHCESCKALIEDVCKETDGVISCAANFKTGKVEVEHSKPLDMKALKKEIEALGKYKVVV